MIATIVNSLAILIGGFIGISLKKGIPEKISATVMQGLALCVLYIGISGALKGQNVMLIIISVVLGSLVGEAIDIEEKLRSLGEVIENKFKGKKGKISEGFVTASLLFCVGAMAIVGSLESGLSGEHKTLFAKSILDGVSSIIFASSLGIGVIFSAFSVLLYQGTITLGASFLTLLLTPNVINDITSIGSLLIIGLSINMLKIGNIKVANLLPAVFIPIIYQFINMIFF